MSEGLVAFWEAFAFVGEGLGLSEDGFWGLKRATGANEGFLRVIHTSECDGEQDAAANVRAERAFWGD